MAKRLLVRVRVTRIDLVAERIKLFHLTPLYRDKMPPFQAGDHVRLRLTNGTLRTFSLCGDPRDLSGYQIAVLREECGRGGSAAIHDRIQVGDELHVSYPEPGLRLHPAAHKHILIAGGIGITPFLGMAINRQVDLELHYAARSRDAAAFLTQLRQCLGDNLKTYLSNEGKHLNITSVLETPTEGTHVYACGPERLTTAVRTTAAQRGWGEGSVHLESFAGLTGPEASHGDPFDVSLLVSNRNLTVPSDKSLLEVLRKAGIPIEYSCEGGVCGTCSIEYRDGDPIHRDSCLSPTERTTRIMCCVSRAHTHLSLVI